MDYTYIGPLIIFVAGVWFFVIGVNNFRQRKFFAKNGIHTKATVIDVIKRIKGGKHKRTYYVHTLEYRADDACTTSEINESFPHDVGYEYDILYSPDNPKKIMTAERIDNVVRENVKDALYVVTGVIIVIVSAIFVYLNHI